MEYKSHFNRNMSIYASFNNVKIKFLAAQRSKSVQLDSKCVLNTAFDSWYNAQPNWELSYTISIQASLPVVYL